MWRTIKNIILLTLPSLVIVLLVLELFFRYVIPASDSPRGYFNEKDKIYCLSNKKVQGVYTIGRFAEVKGKWRINNMNWNSPIDYVPVKDKKLIAVIGDSFIESFQVNTDENYPSLLRKDLEPEFQVYSFGKSGAPLSQYVNMSRYVNKYFNPDILIFNIVHNDFDESIKELFPENYFFLQVSVGNNDSIFETEPRPNYSFVQYKPLKGIIYKSALFRYLYINLNAADIRNSASAKKNKSNSHFEANVESNKLMESKPLISLSTNYLVKTIKKENPEKRIIFIFDAPRESIYKNTANESSILWMHEMLKVICEKNKIEYIDLTPLMQQDYSKNKKKFNSDIDGHYNQYGHRFVTTVLENYLKTENYGFN